MTRPTSPIRRAYPARPTLLFYCQHSLGLGHLARSLILEAATGLTTTVVAGPFLPEPVWTWLQGEAERSPALTAIRQVPDRAHEIRAG